MITISRLNSGGIIPVYRCPAACRHCMYGCSNQMSGRYIDAQQCEKLCESMCRMGARSAHIGGGEPFLSFDGLCTLVQTMRRYGLAVEYIETNAAWCVSSMTDQKIIAMLQTLKGHGADCLLISVDPFHVEYVPVGRPVRLAQLCEKAGMDYFIWQQKFLRLLSQKLDPDKVYTRTELETILGKDYVYDTARQYGLGYNGRALNIAREYHGKIPTENLLKNPPCKALSDVNHYHADLNSYFIAPGCTGIGVPLEDLRTGVDPGKYPVYTTLSQKGVAGLLEYAVSKGFQAEKAYVSGCELCYACRKYLLDSCPSADIYPTDYYRSNF